MNLAKRSEHVRQVEKISSKRSEHVYTEEFEYRSEANRFDSDFVFKKRKKANFRFFLKTKGKKRRGSLVNYRSFAITRRFHLQVGRVPSAGRLRMDGVSSDEGVPSIASLGMGGRGFF